MCSPPAHKCVLNVLLQLVAMLRQQAAASNIWRWFYTKDNAQALVNAPLYHAPKPLLNNEGSEGEALPSSSVMTCAGAMTGQVLGYSLASSSSALCARIAMHDLCCQEQSNMVLSSVRSMTDACTLVTPEHAAFVPLMGLLNSLLSPCNMWDRHICSTAMSPPLSLPGKLNL